MKKFLTLICLSALALFTYSQTQNPLYLEYIQKYRDLAIEQQRKHRVPAAITMAQGILESAAGTSELATKANNHFGIKCTSDWEGKTYTYDDDRPNECFRSYGDATYSYEDHSLFLLRKRYESLFALPIGDYKAWAYGLKNCGYATDPKYPEKLINLIELYNLQALTLDKDLQAAGFVKSQIPHGPIPLNSKTSSHTQHRVVSMTTYIPHWRILHSTTTIHLDTATVCDT